MLGTLLLHFFLVPRALLTQDTWQHLHYRRTLAAAQSKMKCTQYSRPPPLAYLARTPERWLGVPLCLTTHTEASESSTVGTNSKAAGEATDTKRAPGVAPSHCFPLSGPAVGTPPPSLIRDAMLGYRALVGCFPDWLPA